MPYVLLADRAVLRLSGADTREFLQGLITNDVDRVTPRRAGYAALLTPQGKYLFDFFIAQQGEALLLDCEAARAGELLKRLKLYRLRAKVEIEDISENVSVAALFDDDIADDMALSHEEGAARNEGEVCLYIDPRLADAGVRAILPKKRAAAYFEAMGYVSAGLADYDEHRLRLGLPDGSRDLAVDKAIVVESNFEELHGVDFKKGCYVGQELTARTKYRGLVRRKLLAVEVSGPLPQPGTQITLDGKDAGTVQSGRGSRAMALLRLEPLQQVLDAGAELTAGEARLRPIVPDWLKLELPQAR